MTETSLTQGELAGVARLLGELNGVEYSYIFDAEIRLRDDNDIDMGIAWWDGESEKWLWRPPARSVDSPEGRTSDKPSRGDSSVGATLAGLLNDVKRGVFTTQHEETVVSALMRLAPIVDDLIGRSSDITSTILTRSESSGSASRATPEPTVKHEPPPGPPSPPKPAGWNPVG